MIPQNSEKRYLPFITIMYGVAVLLVVFGHSHPLHCDYPQVVRNIIGFIYNFHMPLFFFIAGILIRNNRTPNLNIVHWWLDKVKKLFIPYVVLTLVAIVPKFLLGDVMNDNMELSVSNVVEIIFMPRRNIWGHFWFIPVFLILELIGMSFNQLMLKLENQKKAALLLVVELIAVVLGFYFAFYPIKAEWFGITDVCLEFVYVILGIYVCKYFIERNRKIAYTPLVVVSLPASLFLWFFFRGNLVVGKTVTLLMIYFTMGFCMLIEPFKNSFLKAVGRRAFTIFIWSWPVQAVVELVLVLKLNAPWFITYSIMFVCGLIGPLVIYRICDKIFPNNWFVGANIGRVK
jgi:fucose 4-O-acetylase-like acetyltransferase